jgi:acrylyl-CoA reductase (NADPH)
MVMGFKAVVVRELDSGVRSGVEELDMEMLPDREVTVRVLYSTLNYKDGMVMAGVGRIVRSYPHIPGVDLVGEVVTSRSSSFSPGDRVIVTGFRMGEISFGGYAEFARVDASWIVPLPDSLSAFDAMAFGTAGLTAMLGVMALEEHGVSPKDLPTLVTGAAGGVGSVAVALLSALGFVVAASTGREEEAQYLKALGAREIVARSELEEPSTRPLESERWNGAIDSVGGTTLGRLLGQLSTGSAVAAVGLAGGSSFEASVLPLLLRGVTIAGIDSVMAPVDRRLVAWRRLGETIDAGVLSTLVSVVTLEDLPPLAAEILHGKVRGRVVVNVGAE